MREKRNDNFIDGNQNEAFTSDDLRRSFLKRKKEGDDFPKNSGDWRLEMLVKSLPVKRVTDGDESRIISPQKRET